MRAKIVRHAEEYLWSSAVAHVKGGDATGLLDMAWWRAATPPAITQRELNELAANSGVEAGQAV